MTAADPKLRQRVVQFKVPFVTAASCLYRNNACGEAAKLCEVRRLEYFDRLDAIDWNRHAELSGCRISNVGGVYYKRAAMLPGSGDLYFTFGGANNPRYQRQSVFDGGGLRGNVFYLGALEISRRRCGFFYLLLSACMHGYSVRELDLRNHGELDFDWRPGRKRDVALRQRFE